MTKAPGSHSVNVLLLDPDPASEYLFRLAAAGTGPAETVTAVNPGLRGAFGRRFERLDLIVFHLTVRGITMAQLSERLAQHPDLAGVPVTVVCEWIDEAVPEVAKRHGFGFLAAASDLDAFLGQITSLLRRYAVPTTFVISRLYGYAECVHPVRQTPTAPARRIAVPDSPRAMHRCAAARKGRAFSAPGGGMCRGRLVRHARREQRAGAR